MVKKMHIWGKKSLHSKTMQAKFKVKRKLYRYFVVCISAFKPIGKTPKKLLSVCGCKVTAFFGDPMTKSRKKKIKSYIHPKLIC